MLPHLSQQEAKEFDNWLMSPSGGAYTLQQLMELAGLTVALVIAKYYPNNKNIFIATGPGNNGGDGLVAARHLAIFNYSVTIYRPEFRKQDSDFFRTLIIQAEASGVRIISKFEQENLLNHDLVIDALFGFGFKGDLRAPFDECIDKIIKSNIPIVSVDCPTGWKVEVESQSPTKLQPEMLISLTAPKECAKYFNGPHHILGGRFIPKYLPLKFQKLIIVGNLYKENELFIELSK